MYTTLQLSAVCVKYIHAMKLQGSIIYTESEELKTYGMHQEKLLDAQASWYKNAQAKKTSLRPTLFGSTTVFHAARMLRMCSSVPYLAVMASSIHTIELTNPNTRHTYPRLASTCAYF